MKNFGFFVFIIIVLVAGFAYWQLRKIKEISVEISEFSIKSFSLKKMTGWIKVEVENKSDISAFIVNYVLDVYADGVKIGTVNNSPNLKIKAKEKTIIQVDYLINPSELITTFNLMQLLKEKGIIFRAVGFVTLRTGNKNIEIPIDFSESLENLKSDETKS